ncbi:MAG: Glutathione transport system permease protein GsiD [Myxococcota bacterium]|nr:Glutathione transport system permease protein GsiD [Myxococcota bacterium]
MGAGRVKLGLGFIILAGLGLAALFAPWLVTHDPQQLQLSDEFAPVSVRHWMGAGVNGVDIYSTLIHGARTALLAGGGTVMLSAAFGVSIGCASGYLGGWTDEAVMRVTDIFLAFPGILLAIAIAAVMGPSIANVIFALSATGWVGYARLARAQTLALKNREFVTAALALGAAGPYIMRRHLLPNMAGPLLVQATFGAAGAILAEASLSFLGLGAPLGAPSWGALLDSGVSYLLVAPHVAIFPGLAIFVTVLGLNLLGEGLRERLDPKS